MGSRRRLGFAVGAVGLLSAACGGGLNAPASPTLSITPSPASSVSPSTVATPTVSGVTGTPTATTSPVAGSITTGIATLTATGDAQTTQSMPLTNPAVYAPPPGTFVLNWSSGAAGFAMTGPSFVGSRPSSTSLQVSLSIHTSSGTFTFASTDGSCQITVTTADPTDFAGSFSCPSVTDVGGTVTVSAQGTFTATG